MPAQSHTSRKEQADCADALRDLVNQIEGDVHCNLHDRLLYATDASIYQVEPLGVVVPRSIEDLARTVRHCHAHRLAMLPRSGGTSLAGQCTNRAVVIDVSNHLRGISDLDIDSRTVVAEAGATIEDVNRHLDEQQCGLFFAPDPATLRQACVGGVIGNNAAGARSIRYGRTSENIAAIDAILADGIAVTFGGGLHDGDARRNALGEAVRAVVLRRRAQIAERYPKTIRRNAGYNLDMLLAQLNSAPESPLDLAPLLCGSEGTLAMTARARLKLHPKPIARGLAVVAFGSLEDAIERVTSILETGPTAVEVIDDFVISLARRNLECNRYVDLLPRDHGKDPVAALYVEYSAMDDGEALESSFAALRDACPGAPVQTHTDARSMEDAWKLRQSGEPLLHGMPGDRKPITFVEDNAVPTERLVEFVAGFKSILREHGTTAAFFAHASVGVLHVRPLISIRDDGDRRRIEPIACAAAELARSLGGVMSGEHGDGRVRTPFLKWYYGAEIVEAFREIKRLFDPAHLLNPGNIVDPRPTESIQTDLRIDAERTSAAAIGSIETHFDYSEQHGLLGAIEACNGSGLCRKRTDGTMCPSYMALGEERHATRGRANALRMAITGQLSSDGAPLCDDQDTVETLDLCLSCKACKAECPTNVDIARLKAEYTARRYAHSGGPSLDVRILAEVRRIQRWAAFAPTISNALLRFGPSRGIAKSIFGFHPRRSLPPFGPSIHRRLSKHRGAGDGRPRVWLFADCFTAYGESHIAMAAVRVLEAFGYGVNVLDVGCCGRPAVSLGMLDLAGRQIGHAVGAVLNTIGNAPATPILFLEPSCLSSALDEWVGLKIPGVETDARRAIARRCESVESFLDREWAAHPNQPGFDSADSQDLILHEHCHQKALLGAGHGANTLRRLAPERVTVLDAGCCGMAGAWGMARRRFDLSMQIGERALFPSLREAPANASVIAPGTSCRHQILDGASIHARHPVEAIDSMISHRKE